MTQALIPGCGLIQTGGGFNDPVPNGTVVATGTFGNNSHGIYGTVSVYKLASDGSYVIRLESLQAPNESNLQVTGTAGGTQVYSAALRGTSGNQNYSTGLTGSLTWDSVSIVQPFPTIQTYATAVLF